MKYTLDNLKERFDKGEELKYLFFWGHTQKDGEITKSCFSQWYKSPFTVDGNTYTTAEHWMMAKKALLFANNDIFEQTLKVHTPAEAKKLGRKVKNFDEKIWNDNRMNIVVEGNLHKFSQHPDLADFLRNTYNKILVEASPVDNIWGIGLNQNSKGVYNPYKWRGENLLGFALMEVRDRLTEI